MIYLFSGNDTKNKHSSYEKFIKSIPASTETFFINRNDFNRMQIESLYSGSGLFFAKSAVIFSNVFEYEETRDFILEKLELMGKSANSFVFLEGKLNKPILDAFKKALPAGRQGASAMNIFELPKAKTEKFDNFLVANAFERKDKLNMWICFRQAMDKGVGMEEIIGVLSWKIKEMVGRNPPDRTVVRAGSFNKFSREELEKIASRLSYLLPEARKKGQDAESVFERFLLEAF